jgi:hypothetical protein
MVSKTTKNIIIAFIFLGILLLVFLQIEMNDTPETGLDSVSNTVEETSKRGDIFDYTTWDCKLYRKVNKYYVAPDGYVYSLVTIHIKNEGNDTYTTNPWNWEFRADGITYQHDSSTYSDNVNHVTVDVGPGAEIETQFVYLIKENPKEISLIYQS